MPTPRCFKIHPADNVATLLDDAPAGPVNVLGEAASSMTLLEPIQLGHKVALTDIPKGGAITKFGVRVGHALRDVRAGEWLHLHNIASDFDERSKTLDVHTGAVTDTKYE